MRKKKILFLAMTILGGFLVMTGCQENKDSREWIEDKVSEVSRVYPTENLFDLFKEFPEGFEISSTNWYHKTSTASYSQQIELTGDANSKTISGTLKNVKSEANPYRETILLESDVTYTENGLEFSNPDVSEEALKYKGFLFQRLPLNKQVLSQLQLKQKWHDWDTGDIDVSYYITDDIVNNYLKENKNETVTLGLDFSNSALIGYQFGFSVSLDGPKSDYRESVLSHKVNEEVLRNDD